MDTERKRREVTVACVQMSMQVGNKEANLNKAKKEVVRASEQGAEIILLPELFNTEYFAMWRDTKYFDYAEPIPGHTTDVLSEIAQKQSIYIIAPFFEEEGPGIYYNSAVLIGNDGRLIGKQRKMHIPALKSLEKLYFRPAEANFPVFKTKYGRIAVCICYDRLHPEVMRALALNGAEIIFCPIAGAIYPKVSTLDTRALENGVFVVAVNRVGEEGGFRYIGGSTIIDPEGNIIAKAADEEELLIKTIDIEKVWTTRKAFPFLRDRRPELYDRVLKPAVYHNPNDLFGDS